MERCIQPNQFLTTTSLNNIDIIGDKMASDTATVDTSAASAASANTAAATPNVSEKEDTSWIKITVAGMTAGVVVAAVTYSAAENSSHALATATSASINLAGRLVGLGADYIGGAVLGTTVRIVSSAAAETTKQSIITSGRIGSAAVAATAGAVTALTITVGTRLVEYTIEYGGQLTREAAVRLSEMYLKYKSIQSGFVETGNINDLNADQWVIIGDPTLVEDDVNDNSISDEISVTESDPKGGRADGTD
jgi:hypothetical protein